MMKTIRLIAAILLLISGLLHILVCIQSAGSPGNVGVLLFGLLYVIIGVLLFSSKQYPVYLGIIIPLIGMTLSLIKFGIPEVFSFPALFKLLEVIVVACCCVILFKKEKK